MIETTLYYRHTETRQLNRAWYPTGDTSAETQIRSELRAMGYREITRAQWLRAGGRE